MASVIDLFAGCGGMTEGFRASGLGFEPVAAVEWELGAAATYAINFGESHTRWEDIADFEVPGKADVVIGGPPCQGFSNLGSKDVNDPRNKLWKEYMRVVLEANPQVFVLENVERFSRSTEFALLMNELASGRLRKWKHFEPVVLAENNHAGGEVLDMLPQCQPHAFAVECVDDFNDPRRNQAADGLRIGRVRMRLIVRLAIRTRRAAQDSQPFAQQP